MVRNFRTMKNIAVPSAEELAQFQQDYYNYPQSQMLQFPTMQPLLNTYTQPMQHTAEEPHRGFEGFKPPSMFEPMTECGAGNQGHYTMPAVEHMTPEAGGKVKKAKKTPKPDSEKRTTNAFFCWSVARRKEIKTANPKMHNIAISKQLGEEWKVMPEEEKEKYKQEAHKIKLAHMKANPEYKYTPKQKRAKMDANVEESHKKIPIASAQPSINVYMGSSSSGYSIRRISPWSEKDIGLPAGAMGFSAPLRGECSWPTSTWDMLITEDNRQRH